MAKRVQEGDRVVTCGSQSELDGAGKAILGPKVYIASIRKKDSVLVWRLNFEIDTHLLSSLAELTGQQALRVSKKYARDHGYPFLEGVKHNQEVSTRRASPTPKTTKRVKKIVDGQTVVVEEQLLIGRFRRIDSDDIV